MGTFTYEPAGDLGPLKVGDTVEVIDSRGTAVSKQIVRQIGPLVVTTQCGRTWTREHGEWISEFKSKKPVRWPFPSIRKAHAEGRP